MATPDKVFSVNPRFFEPFNDAPEFISGNTSIMKDDGLVMSGKARYQLDGWYNIGLRTRTLESHSFAFSAQVTPRADLGAYSLGIIGEKRVAGNAAPAINISHFLKSSVRLHQEQIVPSFFSGFGRDDTGHRTQIGEKIEEDPVGKSYLLTVRYDAREQLLSCSVFDYVVLYIRAALNTFKLEMRVEAVGVAGDFKIAFDKLRYYTYDTLQPMNVLELTGRRVGDTDLSSVVQANRLRPAPLNTFRVPESQPADGATDAESTASTSLPETISILFLSADPTDAARLRQGEELREIQEKLKISKQRKRFVLHQQTSARPADISQAMLDHEPQIVHFSGHGSATGALSFESLSGTTHPVEPAALAELFSYFAETVSCVVINACYSESQANAIADHVDCVVGMTKAISDKAAIAFSIGFYQALGANRSIDDAYRLGCVQIGLQGFPENSTPILIKRRN